MSAFDSLPDPEFFEVEAYRVELAAPLLVLKAPKGVLACGYLNPETMNKLSEAGAIVTGVKNYQEMLDAQVVFVSAEAAKLGVVCGQSGRDALQQFCKK